MIEMIGTSGYETISAPNQNSTAVIQALLASGNAAPMIAEIGIGIGATTVAMATLLANRGELHLYNFREKVAELTADLANLGYTTIKGFGNTGRHWDSYNWTLGRMILGGREAVYDYIYIDGAHTFAVDGLAFVLCDRLLKPGGYLEFDDYNWSFAASCWMHENRDQFMTDEQISTPQVKMVVDLFLHGNAVTRRCNRTGCSGRRPIGRQAMRQTLWTGAVGHSTLSGIRPSQLRWPSSARASRPARCSSSMPCCRIATR